MNQSHLKHSKSGFAALEQRGAIVPFSFERWAAQSHLIDNSQMTPQRLKRSDRTVRVSGCQNLCNSTSDFEKSAAPDLLGCVAKTGGW
ncbi:hypothetical protein IFO70_19505 [Phormidium tenue FACHB-886]|nr:hypothetical protein [Phormidium tenue FACHB-886]